MKTNPNDGAFAAVAYGDATRTQHQSKSEGLTKREYFAAMAMQGLLSAVYSSKEMMNDFMKYDTGRHSISENALSYADALIAQLNKDPEQK